MQSMTGQADKGNLYSLPFHEDFFDGEAIQWVEEQSNGKEYVLFYIKICLKSLKHNGVLIRTVGNLQMAYTPEKMAELTRTNVDTVRTALFVLQKAGLVEPLENGTFLLPEVVGVVHKNKNTPEAIKQARHRKNKKAKEVIKTLCTGASDGNIVQTANVQSNENVTDESNENVTDESNESVTDESNENVTDESNENVTRDRDRDRDRYRDRDKEISTTVVVDIKKNGNGESCKEYNLFDDIQYTLGIFPSKYEADKYLELLKEVGEFVLHKALEKAAKANVKKFNYVEAVAKGIAAGNDYDNKRKSSPGLPDWDAIREQVLGGEADGN